MLHSSMSIHHLGHRADSGYDDMSIELSLEEVIKLAGQMGFRMLRNETVQAPYMGEYLTSLSL